MTQLKRKTTFTKIVGNSMKLVWMLNKDLIQIHVMEQLKILIIYLAINKAYESSNDQVELALSYLNLRKNWKIAISGTLDEEPGRLSDGALLECSIYALIFHPL